MKKSILFLAFLLPFTFINAQTEIKLSPIALLAGAGAVSVEYGLSDDWGTEADILVGPGIFWAYGSIRHYFNPRRGLDKFYAGMFAGGVSGDGDGDAGLGFLLGTKWVSRSNVTFEMAFGIGRGFGDIGVLPYGKFHVGYRFSSKK